MPCRRRRRVGLGGLPILFSYNPVGNQSLPSGTFTRASVAEEYDGVDFTSVISGAIRENSAAVSAGAQGYLSEPAATNLVLNNDLNDGVWTQDRINVTNNGVNSLGLIEFNVAANGAGGSHRIFDSLGSATDHTQYWLLKEGSTGRYAIIRSDTSTDYAVFDLQTGTTTETSGITSATITLVNDGWYKCEILDGSNSIVFLAISNSATPGTSSPSFTGSQDILACHSQLEATAFSTSLIITSGSTVTRVAEVLDTDQTIASAFGALLDVTLPLVIPSGDTISLLAPDATAEDIILVDDIFNIIMDDGGTPTTIGTSTSGARIKVSYGRDGTGRSGSLDGATVVTGDAPGAGHEGDTFQLGAANSVNQSRCIHHLTTIYSVRPTDSQLKGLSS